MKILLFIIFMIFLFTLMLMKKNNDFYEIQLYKKLINNYKDKLNVYNEKYNEKYTLFYPVYYINMDKSVDRRLYMENQLIKYSDNYTRIKGIDGSKIKNKYKDTIDGVSFRNFYSNMSNEEIGCFLSHIIAIKTSFNRGEKIAIICEDDVYLETISIIPSLEKIVNNAPEDWEILKLVSNINKNSIKTISYIKCNSTYATCYIINQKGMEKLLNIVLKNDKIYIKPLYQNQRKGVIDIYMFQLINTYILSTSLFLPDNTILNSTIHLDHLGYHLKLSKNILSNIPLPQNKINEDVVIICARYKRDVSFLDKIKYKSVILTKNEDVPNIANESTTYLKYIIDNYEKLPEIMIFIHDENQSWHHDGKLTIRIPKMIDFFCKKKMGYYEFNNSKIDNDELINSEKVTNFWRDVFQKPLGFGEINEVLPIGRKCCAQFIVSKSRVLCRSKKFYVDYYDWLIKNTKSEGNGCKSDISNEYYKWLIRDTRLEENEYKFDKFSGYNTGRYAEWTWYAVFNGENCINKI